MLCIIIILLIFSGFGFMAIVMGYVKIKTCPISYDQSRLLSIVGIMDIILCVLISIIVQNKFLN